MQTAKSTQKKNPNQAEVISNINVVNKELQQPHAHQRIRKKEKVFKKLTDNPISFFIAEEEHWELWKMAKKSLQEAYKKWQKLYDINTSQYSKTS